MEGGLDRRGFLRGAAAAAGAAAFGTIEEAEAAAKKKTERGGLDPKLLEQMSPPELRQYEMTRTYVNKLGEIFAKIDKKLRDDQIPGTIHDRIDDLTKDYLEVYRAAEGRPHITSALATRAFFLAITHASSRPNADRRIVDMLFNSLDQATVLGVNESYPEPSRQENPDDPSPEKIADQREA